MTIYHITWQIDLEAETPIDAARKALEMIQEEDSIATVFRVKIQPKVTRVDLSEVFCNNCAWHGAYGEEISPIPNFQERVDPKGQVPACECPACCSLAYWRD